MLHFDETALKQRLGRMPWAARLSFAVAVAERQLSSYECHAAVRGFPEAAWPRQVVGRLRESVRLGVATGDAWPDIVEDILNRYPPEDPDAEGFLDLMAQQAISSLAYAIRCLLSGDAQEAAWAGLCEYEAADQAAIKILKIDLNVPGAEAAILSHAYVQRTLRAQQDDLALLEAARIGEVLERSAALSTFANDELDRFA
jgi:hypothetical protein